MTSYTHTLYFKNKKLRTNLSETITNSEEINDITRMQHQIGESHSKKIYQIDSTIYVKMKSKDIMYICNDYELTDTNYINCYSIVHKLANDFLHDLESENKWLKVEGSNKNIINQMDMLKDVLLTHSIPMVLKRVFIVLKYAIDDEATDKEWKPQFLKYSKLLH